jgi:hypothetical protein
MYKETSFDTKTREQRMGEEKVNYWYVVALVVLFIVTTLN